MYSPPPFFSKFILWFFLCNSFSVTEVIFLSEKLFAKYNNNKKTGVKLVNLYFFLIVYLLNLKNDKYIFLYFIFIYLFQLHLIGMGYFNGFHQYKLSFVPFVFYMVKHF